MGLQECVRGKGFEAILSNKVASSVSGNYTSEEVCQTFKL